MSGTRKRRTDGRHAHEASPLEKAKLEALRQLAYGASHEINNPLANISARAQALLRDEHDPERRRALEAIDQQALRAHEMISDLMLFARPPQLAPQTVCPTQLIGQVASQFAELCRARRITLVLETAAAPTKIDADPTQLAAALQALVRNSVEAIGSDGIMTLAIEPAKSPLTGTLFTVTDDGPGMSPEVRAHACDPFFSGREAGRGLGFGLSKSWRIATLHGGTLQFEAPPKGGTRALLQIPPRDESATGT